VKQLVGEMDADWETIKGEWDEGTGKERNERDRDRKEADKRIRSEGRVENNRKVRIEVECMKGFRYI